MILNDWKFLLFKTKNKKKFNIFFDSLNICIDFRLNNFSLNSCLNKAFSYSYYFGVGRSFESSSLESFGVKFRFRFG